MMSAKANQEDFKEIFKDAAKAENVEELEKKLRDLIGNQKSKPALEPTK